jgi:hypothetical protein
MAGDLALGEDQAAAAGLLLGVLRDGRDGDQQDVALAEHERPLVGRGRGFGHRNARLVVG